MPSERPRYKVRFPDAESLHASEAVESPVLAVPVRNERRAFVSITAPAEVVGVAEGVEADVENELDRQLTTYVQDYGAEIVEDVRYDLEEFEDAFELPVAPEVPNSPSLDDVLDLIHAREAWERTRGEGAVIAIVDTGVNGQRPEFPAAKRLGQWAPEGRDPWADSNGHGTMCACIATGTRASGGEFDGVAPDAGLIACRTSFYDSEIVTIYDFLSDFAADHPDLRVVASNSFGRKTGTPPDPPPDTDLADALGDAVEAGIVICFSAGNYHDLAGGAEAACDPTSIWLHKCREDVLTVATTRPDGTMWYYSSRGPGQFDGEAGMRAKPDVTAPTPPNGRVVFGDSVQSLPNGWGTSGACPQVAGLAALLLSTRAAPPLEVRDAIRASAVPLGHARDCEGEGIIDCNAAVSAF
jgi:serine protease AprX